ncbi:hypothetical protein H696_00784 [Fonticula alba]|uniref:Nudix hydrolase domain-containing protein n=1 Tax=Fonticula alba TaxID=691883 RepID=A0A058ZH30_FONAL|nr:hypothetical protein H696_00784 [Fonticula alba]KCV73243.1 hypothetical protein H696_00784 [Fonticula alba]|eukprot:XP_009492944.1 hypothetical protein H696_00784 [Fonticula alba]
MIRVLLVFTKLLTIPLTPQTYIYHANWIKGPFVNPRQNEFAWFTKDELREHLPKETFDRLEPLFFDYTF